MEFMVLFDNKHATASIPSSLLLSLNVYLLSEMLHMGDLLQISVVHKENPIGVLSIH